MLALCATLCCTGERAARADTPQPAASRDARKAQAKAKYEQGVELYRNERYADAVRFFLEADALSPSAALSFNIARAYEKLADDAATLRWYRNYLRLNPEAANATEVRQSIQTLSLSLAKKGIQQLTVLSTPAGATVAIDNRALGVTPLTIELKPGKHHALVTLRGFRDAATDFTLSAPAPLDLPFELQVAPAELPPLSAGASETGAAHEARRRFGVAPYITLAAGAVALGGAALFEISRRSAEDSVQSDKTQLAAERDIDVMNNRQTTARVLLGVGGVLVATGGALLVFNTRVGPESNAGLSALPGGAAFSFRRSF
ncbi:MAG TPA: PEGA domain-containing protein [Polyangiaceae bacterium]|jgi:tetratricopeptide (TPR) repeat protein|nr:PEGA domain-containing protein [Polyangiaceae bacterium]